MNNLNAIENIRKEDHISTIKFIGRQHCILTNIMDQINSCYSFQVWCFSKMFIIFVQISWVIKYFIQIIVNAAIAVMFSVLTSYTFYRYVLQQNFDFEDISGEHFAYELLFITSTLASIYRSNRVSSEVNRVVENNTNNDSILTILINSFSTGTGNNINCIWNNEFMRWSRNCGNGIKSKIDSLELNFFY